LIFAPSPNFDVRPGPVDVLVLHYTGMQSAGAALERLCDPVAKVSSHYLVDEDGTAYRLVEEQNRAWHAGVSSWRGVARLNDASIGIEIVNPGHEFGYRAFPEAQMAAVLELCRGIIGRHKIPARNVVAHSDIAPDRKQDPGELFPWRWLAGEGVGLWTDEFSTGDPRGYFKSRSGESDGGDFRAPERSVLEYVSTGAQKIVPRRPPERFLKQPLMDDLAAIGYDVAVKDVVTAFQRHFLPDNLSGEADARTTGRAASVRALVDRNG
jgi:N-acetylmuramoyl-L-alanine amidase